MEENYTFRDPSISFSDSRSPLTADVVVPSLQLALEYPVSSLRSPPFTTRLSLPLPASLFRPTKKNNDLSSYQGDQHYDSNEFFGDTIVRQANDAEKKQNLERIGYPLIYLFFLFFFYPFFFRSPFFRFEKIIIDLKDTRLCRYLRGGIGSFQVLKQLYHFNFLFIIFFFSFNIYFLIFNLCSFPSPSLSLSLSFSFFWLFLNFLRYTSRGPTLNSSRISKQHNIQNLSFLLIKVFKKEEGKEERKRKKEKQRRGKLKYRSKEKQRRGKR